MLERERLLFENNCELLDLYVYLRNVVMCVLGVYEGCIYESLLLSGVCLIRAEVIDPLVFDNRNNCSS